ncbi:MAG: site-specific integrase [Acidobacteriota bacterium]|nr:site-specific integrase [Acidobacteriota bacterium]
MSMSLYNSLPSNETDHPFMEDCDMGRRRGRQKGYLKREGPSWIGYWWEEVRLADGTPDWHRASRVICRTQKISETGRQVKVTKPEAQKIFNETVLDGLEVRSVNPQSLATLKEFVELKYRPILVMRRRKTQEHLRNMLDNHILPALGNKQLRGITPDVIENLILAKLGAGKSSQTVWHIRTTLTTIFKRAKRNGWYSGDLPTQGVEMPALVHAERTALTKEQALALLERLEFDVRAMVLVLAFTGLRIGELSGLRWRRVNLTNEAVRLDGESLEANSLAVRESYIRVYGKALDRADKGGKYQEVKTRKARRDVPLISLAVQALEAVKSGTKFSSPEHPVFAGRLGQPVDTHNHLARKLKPALIELGLPGVSWHDLRHTAATFADQAGLTEAERQRILGHASGKMTQHYTKAEIEHVRKPMEAMSAGFEKVMDRRAEVVEIRKKTG